MSTQTEIVTVVDHQNRVIGAAPRSEMRRRNLIHRASYVLVFNTAGQLFIQKRTDSKDIYPGHYDIAAGGVVLACESYEQSARRELQEELGVEAPLEFLFDHYYGDSSNRVWGRIFRCQHNGPFQLQVEEVASGQFMSLSEIAAQIAEQGFTPDGADIFLRLSS